MGRKKKTEAVNKIDKHVGQKIRQRRNLLGLTQGDLADYLDIRYQQIQKYERGQNRVAAGTLFQLSKILQIPIKYFFEDFDKDGEAMPAAFAGLAENEQVPFSGDDPMDKKETMNLVRAYYNIPDEKQRKRVYELIKSLGEDTKEE
ncbi:MAG: transcriptional regulator [Rickettsiales bacterium]|nr:transcriptional regulator [Rickettsiales bacterium]|tara:strand:- start:270 stop:707 length:438 start_codon:yes stop_codon:yes gene_type:complete